MADSAQTPLYNPDDKSSVYDEKGSKNPLSSSDLSSSESGAAKSDKGQQTSNAPSSDKEASAKSLNHAEAARGFYNNSSSALSQGLKAGAGGELSAAKSFAKAATGFFAGHKKGTAAGGGVVGLFIFLAIFGAGFVVTHELVTIEKTLLRYEAKIEQKFEKTAGKKLMQKIICIRTKSCKPGTEGDGEDSKGSTENADPAASAPDEALNTEMNAAADSLTSPVVEADLAKAGVIESTAGGDLTLKDSSGANITDDISSNTDGAGDLVETAIPEFDEGQVQSFGPEMTLHAGVTEDPITSENEKDPTKAVEDDVLDGASSAEIVADAEVVDNQAPNKNATAAQTAADTTNAGTLSDEINATDKAIAQGESSTKAIAAGEEAAGTDLAGTVAVSSAASEVCSIDKIATDAAKSRVPKIVTLLIRHGALVLSLADELKAGALNGGVVNKVMGLFNGNPSAPPTVDPTTGKSVPSQDVLPFSDSEEYQKASGGTGGVPIDSSSLPTANAGTAVVSDINGVLKKSVFGDLTCKIENSPFASLANGLVGIAQIVGDIGSIGAAQILETAGLVALQQTIQHVIIPDILKYFTPVGLDGLESSTQLGNNAGLGMNLASNDYARSEGANPVPTTTANTLASEATQEQNIADSRLSWVNRTFALSNTDSLVSRLITHVPLGLSATINGAVNYLETIPSSLLHDLSTIFSPRVSALTAVKAPGVSDGVTQYAFTDSSTDKYDPLGNENYLFSNVTFDGKSARRIDMLGNPNTVSVDTNGDEVGSNSDLLHCYIDGFTQLQEAQSTSPGSGIDTNCYVAGVYALGSYDYNDSTPASPDQVDSTLDNTIVNIYCTALGAPPGSKYFSPGWYDSNGVWHVGCAIIMPPQIIDDIGHFRQYILDVHVMKDYKSLMTTQ